MVESLKKNEATFEFFVKSVNEFAKNASSIIDCEIKNSYFTLRENRS